MRVALVQMTSSDDVAANLSATRGFVAEAVERLQWADEKLRAELGREPTEEELLRQCFRRRRRAPCAS